MIIAGCLGGAGTAAEHHSRAPAARVDGRAGPPQAVPAVRLGVAAVGHLEGGDVGRDGLAGRYVGVGDHETAACAVASERCFVRYFWVDVESFCSGVYVAAYVSNQDVQAGPTRFNNGK